MELKGKKILFLGDSITEGGKASSIENVYWNVVGSRTGALCYGYGVGGTRIAPHIVPSDIPKYDLYFGSRVDDMRPDADIVVVFGGTNDFGHGDALLGTMADRDEKSFYGAYHTLLLKLINKYPDARIVVMTPLHRVTEDDMYDPVRNRRRAANLETYVNAIQEVAAYYGIPVLDLFRTSGIQPRVPIQLEKFMPDGLHPNDAGHARVADRLIRFLEAL